MLQSKFKRSDKAMFNATHTSREREISRENKQSKKTNHNKTKLKKKKKKKREDTLRHHNKRTTFMIEESPETRREANGKSLPRGKERGGG